MKKLIFFIFFTLSSNIYAFRGNMFNPNKIISCTPTNYLIAGSQKSTNYGKTYSACTGFSCNPGYTISGATCLLSLTANVSCFYFSELYYFNYVCSTVTNQASLSAQFIAPDSNPITITSTLKKNYNCPGSISSWSAATYTDNGANFNLNSNNGSLYGFNYSGVLYSPIGVDSPNTVMTILNNQLSLRTGNGWSQFSSACTQL